jgi:WD40 repeat protein
MPITRFCLVCGAANDETQTRCFACDTLLPVDAGEEAGETLLQGRYRTGPTIGSGGYSAVFRAWDTQMENRLVAIKRITLQGLDAEKTIEATSTYNREVEALARLSHPQVPRLYDHFSDPEHWYLVLEYIEGQTLEAYLEARAAQQKPFAIEEIIQIGLQLCHVLSYLHSRHPALIFRDLKPDNIMRADGGKLFLIDFGIARSYVPGQGRDTQSLGSPGYAAPEQYGRAQTDLRTDLYGLGALLHQVLSGHDPANTPRGLPPLHQGGQPGHDALVELVTRLLAADPAERPASAGEVARDLERIRLQVVSAQEKTRIWTPPVSRDYAAFNVPQIHLQQQQQQVSPAAQLLRSRKIGRRVLVGGLTAAVVLGSLGGGELWSALRNQNTATTPTQRNVLSKPLFTFKGHIGAVTALAWDAHSSMVCSASEDHYVYVWNAFHENIFSTNTDGGPINTVAWTPENQYITSGGSAGWVQINSIPFMDFAYSNGVDALAWSPFTDPVSQLRTLAVGLGDGSLFLQPADTSGGVITASVSKTSLVGHTDSIYGVAFSPASWYLASASRDQTVLLWDLSTKKQMFSGYHGHKGTVTCVTWLPNGVYLASGSDDNTVCIWDATTGATLLVLKGHAAPVNSIAVSPDGQYLASASADQTVRIWNTFDGSLLLTYTGHSDRVLSVAWSPDGHYIVSGSADKTAQVWSPNLLSL